MLRALLSHIRAEKVILNLNGSAAVKPQTEREITSWTICIRFR